MMHARDYMALLTPELLFQIEQVSLCGNYGDPMLMPNLFGILERLRINPKIRVTVETNGGMHDAAWWRRLAHALNPGSHVTFNIDGLCANLEVYRRNVSYATVIHNATAFIRGGGKAFWSFLPFAHNEHQVESAREISQALGFAGFEVRVTERFYRNDGVELESYTKSGTTLRPATKPEYSYRRDTTQAEYLAQLSSCKVTCKATTEKRVYVDYAGYVFPCCFVSAIYGDDCEDLGTTMIRDRLASYTEAEQPCLRNQTLQQIVEGDFFKWIYDHFDTPQDRPVACSAVCGAGLFKISK
jgi:pyruvate-formate lyase-activating enzyme